MADAARKYEAAHDDPEPDFEQQVRGLLRKAREQAPGCDICFDELVVSQARAMHAQRAAAFEVDARTRENAAAARAYAQGVTARHRALRVVPGC